MTAVITLEFALPMYGRGNLCDYLFSGESCVDISKCGIAELKLPHSSQKWKNLQEYIGGFWGFQAFLTTFCTIASRNARPSTFISYFWSKYFTQRWWYWLMHPKKWSEEQLRFLKMFCTCRLGTSVVVLHKFIFELGATESGLLKRLR